MNRRPSTGVRYLPALVLPLLIGVIWIASATFLRHGANPTSRQPASAVGVPDPNVPSVVDVAPKILKQTPALYPPELKRLGIDGEVTLGFVVDAKGKIANPRVVHKSNPGFVRAALAALESWTFTPGTQDRRPVAARMEATISFGTGDETKGPGLWAIEPPKIWGEQIPENFRFEVAPQLLSTQFAVYPREQLSQGAGARVEMGLVIDPTGQIVRMTVLNDDAPSWAVLAARAMYGSWKLTPARREERPCYAGVRTLVEFSPGGGGTFPLSPSAQIVIRELAKPKPAIVEAADLDFPPTVYDRAVSGPGPWIPPERAHGRVVVEFFIDPQGDVILPTVLSAPNPELGAFAALTVQSWIFAPPIKAGKPVTARATTPLDF